jgi:hypothetical protein
MILALAWKVAKVHFDLEASEVSEYLLSDAGISLNLVSILSFAQVSFSILHSLFMIFTHHFYQTVVFNILICSLPAECWCQRPQMMCE